MNWKEIKNQYALDPNIHYFQSASVSPIPIFALNYLKNSYDQLAKFGYQTWVQDLEKIENFKSQLATLLGTKSSNIAFVANTSTANSLLASSLVQKFGLDFNILSFRDEFPSNIIPYQYQKIPLKIIDSPNHIYTIDEILSSLDSKTKVVITSHVQYCTGFRQNIKELSKELKNRGILFFVNGTQSFPYFHENLEELQVDAFLCSFHKWSGSGFCGSLFYTSENFRKVFKSPVAGWLSVKPFQNEVCYTENDGQFQTHENALIYELGTSNPYPLLTMKLNYEFFESIGYEKIRERLLFLSNLLAQKLKKFPIKIISPLSHEGARSAITAFKLDNRTQKLCEYLIQNKVLVAYRNGNCRADVNIFTSEEDLNFLELQISEFLVK